MTAKFQNSLLLSSSIAAFALMAGPALAQAQDNGAAETVIVTGTRVTGMTAADSAAPIQVLGTDALTHGTGTSDLRNQLGQTVPSFTSQQFANDSAALTLSASLRGLSPNDTLVLVNGHRRHYSANFHVDGGFGSGSSSADLSMIPSAAIDHVEVLLDGAAAQYGTDAIAGVVNIILKNKSSGGMFTAQAGDYYDRGNFSGGSAKGEKYSVSYNMGLPLFDKGFVDFTVEKQYQNFSQFAGADSRMVNAANQAPPQDTVVSVGANGVAKLAGTGNTIPNSLVTNTTGYPRNNAIDGNLEYQLTVGELNAGYDFSDNFSLYAFGTIGHKFGKAMENYRLPDQIIATIGSNQPCSATNPNGYDTASSTADGLNPTCTGAFPIATADGFSAAPGTPGAGLNPVTGQVISSGNAGNLYSSSLFNAQTKQQLPSATGEPLLGTTPELVLYPKGFRPMEVIKEDDYQYNTGMKFNLAGWDVDADVSYGKDIDYVYTWNTGNRTLFIDTHTTPLNFYDGSWTASQLTGTIDATHPFNIGMASPLTVAIGAEAREDTYFIGQGDPLASYKEGAQSFPGFPASGAGRHSRKNYAGYIDFAVAPIEALTLDVAGRVEHYTDFGDTEIGKITARYDFNPQWAIRGTVSTGFRAPTLAEEFYTAVNVSPESANLQLPADSAGAKLLGLQNLKPESSTSFSAGIVAHPFQDLSATVDVYSIAIGKRIVNSGVVNATGEPGDIIAPSIVFPAIALAGVTLDPTATSAGVTAFLNGISTLTQGVDLTVSYPTDFGDYGAVNWTLAGNYNTIHVGSVAPVPAPVLAVNPNATFFDRFAVFGFEHQTPNMRVGLTADWSLDQFGATLREQFWGPRHAYTGPNNSENIPQNQASVVITDLEGRYNLTDQLQLAIGADNLFNLHPDITGAAPPCSNLPNGTIILPGGSCRGGPNKGSGQVLPIGSGSTYQYPVGGFFDPNGGYYYARIVFNF